MNGKRYVKNIAKNIQYLQSLSEQTVLLFKMLLVDNLECCGGVLNGVGQLIPIQLKLHQLSYLYIYIYSSNDVDPVMAKNRVQGFVP